MSASGKTITCARCNSTLHEIEDIFGKLAGLPSTQIQYSGVICVKCKKIECTACKGNALRAPCSWCGGEVAAVTNRNA